MYGAMSAPTVDARAVAAASVADLRTMLLAVNAIVGLLSLTRPDHSTMLCRFSALPNQNSEHDSRAWERAGCCSGAGARPNVVRRWDARESERVRENHL